MHRDDKSKRQCAEVDFSVYVLSFLHDYLMFLFLQWHLLKKTKQKNKTKSTKKPQKIPDPTTTKNHKPNPKAPKTIVESAYLELEETHKDRRVRLPAPRRATTIVCAEAVKEQLLHKGLSFWVIEVR